MTSHLEEPLQWVHMHIKLSQMMFYFIAISYQLRHYQSGDNCIPDLGFLIDDLLFGAQD